MPSTPPKPTTAFEASRYLANAPERPGIYQMLDDKGDTLYVGKAKNIKKRVSSYFSGRAKDAKTMALVEKINDLSFTVTRTENEALLLENNLIKQLKPRYNVLLRDDKSYPYIFLSAHKNYPRLAFHRGPQRAPGRYFGPYPSSSAVRDNLQLLQKLFRLRQCEDTFFRSRTRPCLQYQIKRCTAPCVEFISPRDYRPDVRHTTLFLEGKDQQVIDEVVARMEKAADKQDYELAARYRDQIQSIRKLESKQPFHQQVGDVDVLALAIQAGAVCVQILTVRGGHLLGNKCFYPKNTAGASEAEIMAAFITQFYLSEGQTPKIPARLIISHLPSDHAWLKEALSKVRGKGVALAHQPRGERLKWLKMAQENAKFGLAHHLAGKHTVYQRLEALQDALSLEALPDRMECFDISHTMGEATVASCVVFNQEGPLKSDYRRFNITDITPGDDYAAMKQALTRRYTRVKESGGALPDILFIDGGKGQLSQAEAVLEELQFTDVMLIGIAKGEGRKPGKETLFVSGNKKPLHLPATSAALHLVQQIRDEAHRFALMGHRARRAKQRTRSPLEDIEGVGAKRRRELLRQLGGWQGVARASVDDLAKVPGVSQVLAKRIYDALHH